MDPRPLRIYSCEESPRLTYIAGIIIGDILGLPWEVITDRRKLWKHPVINYSTEDIPGTFRINPCSLLFEKNIEHKDIQVSTWNNIPVFFTSQEAGDFPFDIFAASFFLISRYEEYLAHEPDEHGRFKASSSIAYRNGFLDKPVIDLWVREMSRAFLKKFPTVAFRRNEFRSIVTFDTDEPFAYLGKSLLRSLAGMVGDMAGTAHSVSKRYRTITLEEKDPYDVFDYITESVEKHQSDAKFFFPVGDESKHDLNPSWRNSDYRKLIGDLALKYKTGLHTSYHSSQDVTMIKTEAGRLESILEREVTSCRFHYLRIFFPDTYRHILDAGITEDYSMGYPDEPGFRAGISRPFYFYDLRNEKRTDLKIYPFQVMDSTLFLHKKLDQEAARETVMKLVDDTRKAGGIFISVWHNTSLLDDEGCYKQREVFEFMLKYQGNDSLS
jgi:hypothetical protein